MRKDKVCPMRAWNRPGTNWFNLGKVCMMNEMNRFLKSSTPCENQKNWLDNNWLKMTCKELKVSSREYRDVTWSRYSSWWCFYYLRTVSNIRFQHSGTIREFKNRTGAMLFIYFPEYKTVYGKAGMPRAEMPILKTAPLPRYLMLVMMEEPNGVILWLRAVGARAKTSRDVFFWSKKQRRCSLVRMETGMLPADHELKYKGVLLKKSFSSNWKKRIVRKIPFYYAC